MEYLRRHTHNGIPRYQSTAKILWGFRQPNQNNSALPFGTKVFSLSIPFFRGPGVQNVGCAENHTHDWLDSRPTCVLNMHLSAPAHHNREIWFLVDDQILEVGADVHTHVRRHDPVTSCFTGSQSLWCSKFGVASTIHPLDWSGFLAWVLVGTLGWVGTNHGSSIAFSHMPCLPLQPDRSNLY